MIRMWDLAAAEDDRRFSPYCWRIKMSLAHKGLPVETLPWRFTEKDRIAFSGQGFVPVIVDGERTVHGSFTIATYLDEAYPDAPRLMDGAQSRALAGFFDRWVVAAVHGPILRAILLDLYGAIAEKDKAYFRSSREARFGRPLEEVGNDPAGAIAALGAALEPVRGLLTAQPFVSGAAPAFADYILFGAFQWARAVSPKHLLSKEDAVYAWRERMLDLHDGLARRAKGYEP